MYPKKYVCEYIYYLQTAGLVCPPPWRSLQFLSQHKSLSSVPRRPASHSSSPSTLKFPQNDSSGSEKQRPDLACKTFLIDRKLHGENLCVWKKQYNYMYARTRACVYRYKNLNARTI